MIFQLLDVTAFLSRLQSFSPGICKHPHILCPAYHTIEIIRPNSVLILICRQPESRPEFRRYERRTYVSARKNAFVGRHNYEIIEIKASCFQRSHYLKSFERLSFERNRYSSYQLGKKSYIGRRQYIQSDLLQHVNSTIILLGVLKFK